MKPVEEIERSLGRLAPAALSEAASDSIESMIDSLAQQGSSRDELPAEPRRGWIRPTAWMSLAAAVVLGLFFALPGIQPATGPAARPAVGGDPPAGGLEWVGRTDHVGELEDGGLVVDEDGGMHRLLRYRVVEEELIRDGRNGVVMRVTGPRDEMMLVPVSSF